MNGRDGCCFPFLWYDARVIGLCEDNLKHFSAFVCKVLQYPWRYRSGPAALLGFRFPSCFSIPAVVNTMSSIFRFRSCFSIPAVVNTMSSISGKGDRLLFGVFAVSSFVKTD